MGGAVDEVEQAIGILPDAHVHDDVLAEGAQRGRIIALALEAPDEAGRFLGKLVDPVEIGDEFRQARIVEGRQKRCDVDLREMEFLWGSALNS